METMLLEEINIDVLSGCQPVGLHRVSGKSKADLRPLIAFGSVVSQRQSHLMVLQLLPEMSRVYSYWLL